MLIMQNAFHMHGFHIKKPRTAANITFPLGTSVYMHSLGASTSLWRCHDQGRRYGGEGGLNSIKIEFGGLNAPAQKSI